jgi:hypothetical protein
VRVVLRRGSDAPLSRKEVQLLCHSFGDDCRVSRNTLWKVRVNHPSSTFASAEWYVLYEYVVDSASCPLSISPQSHVDNDVSMQVFFYSKSSILDWYAQRSTNSAISRNTT